MKEYLVHLMKYNQSANNQVIKLLADLNESDRNLDRKSYYKSLQGLFEHIVGAELFLQKIIKASLPEISGLDHKYMDFKLEPGNSILHNFSELKTALETFDSALIEMTESLKDEDMEKIVLFNHPKIKLEYKLGVIIMQCANHGTHHRGQISQILDEMGIDNNFSSILPKYE
ncbi:MAG: DinB family protein [Bacillota bacterium]|nr:DinB family protein [Bacillota bacterium]